MAEAYAAILAKSMYSCSFQAFGPNAPMQEISVGPASFQKVKQPLHATPAFVANGKNCALHRILDVIVHRTLDG
jgi:hypothetical protein